MKTSKIIVTCLRFGLWSTIGTHMYKMSTDAGSPILAMIASLVMFGYAGSIILVAILDIKEELQDVRKDKGK